MENRTSTLPNIFHDEHDLHGFVLVETNPLVPRQDGRTSPRGASSETTPVNASFNAREVNPHILVSRPIVIDEDYIHVDVPIAEIDWSMQYRYGFPSAMCRNTASTEALWWMGYKKSIDAATKEWEDVLAKVETYPPTPTNSKIAIKYGVPPSLRPIIWPQFSGVRERVAENAGYLEHVLHLLHHSYNDQGKQLVTIRHNANGDTEFEAIEKDLTRTFPDHPFFKSPGEGVTKMRNVLRALCWRNPQIGYCQSFNYLVAILVIVLKDEDVVFWHLVHILENVFPADYFADTLIGVKVDQEVAIELTRDHLPKVHAHFVEKNVDIRAILPGWLMTLYVTTFPIETTLRVWDAILLDPDSAAIPLRVAIALFKLMSDELLKCDCASDIMMNLNLESAQLFDAAKLMKTVATIKVTSSMVRKLRYKHRMEMTRPPVQVSVQARGEEVDDSAGSPVGISGSYGSNNNNNNNNTGNSILSRIVGGGSNGGNGSGKLTSDSSWIEIDGEMMEMT